MTIYIKNMVCRRCIMAVESGLEHLEIPYQSVRLGRAELPKFPDNEKFEAFKRYLIAIGFELVEDHKTQMVSMSKQLMVAYLDNNLTQKGQSISLQELFKGKVPCSYKYLSKLFSETQGQTLQQYFLLLKVEKVKELLEYGEMTLTEIADRLGYSSVAHLSNQFKHETGYPPTAYKSIVNNGRKSLDLLS